jgi:hypothetical protein
MDRLIIKKEINNYKTIEIREEDLIDINKEFPTEISDEEWNGYIIQPREFGEFYRSWILSVSTLRLENRTRL